MMILIFFGGLNAADERARRTERRNYLGVGFQFNLRQDLVWNNRILCFNFGNQR